MIMLIFVILLILSAVYIALKSPAKAVEDIKLSVQYKPILENKVDYYHKLVPAEKKRFEKRVAEFLHYIRIEGVGTEVTDDDLIFVASSAVIPVFGFPGWKYKNLTNVLLYPDTFDQNFQYEGDNRSVQGMVGSGFMNGQMILSKAALHKGFSPASGKENTGIHEFVHLLDKADGDVDGVPETLMSYDFSTPWLKLMHQEMHRIESGHSDINVYAITNEAEFLAVTSEYFFEKPEQFKNKHPELYKILSDIFDQDPGTLPIKK